MDEETKKIMEEIDYIEELVKPHGWVLHGHYPRASFVNRDDKYFSLDAIGWKAVKELLEENKELNFILDLQRKREAPYVKKWQKAVNKPNALPDYGDFLKFLLDELERKEDE